MRTAYADQDQIAVLGDLETIDQHERRLLARVVVREAVKILEANEEGRGLPHGVDIQRLTNPPHVRLPERGAPPADLVDVTARDSVMTRMKSVRHLVGGDDVNVGGQLVVQPPPQLLGADAGVELEMRDLREGMNAGVGAAGAIELELARLERVA